MVTDKAGYEHLIQFITENLMVFEQAGTPTSHNTTIGVVIEEMISDQIIQLCTQHTELETVHRALIVREVDGIMYDLQEVLASVLNRPATAEQIELLQEVSLIIKNLFDTAIAHLMD